MTVPESVPFTVAMLAGGASRRMGRAKATLAMAGQELGERVLVAALLAGASEVLAVGGEPGPLEAQGWRHVPDLWPDAGPLGGIISALSMSSHSITVVVACDLPDVDPEALRFMVEECERNPGVDAVLPQLDGRHQVLHAAWRPSARALLAAQFDRGERSPTQALRSLSVELVEMPPGSLADLDTPDDLARYLAAHPEVAE